MSGFTITRTLKSPRERVWITQRVWINQPECAGRAPDQVR